MSLNKTQLMKIKEDCDSFDGSWISSVEEDMGVLVYRSRDGDDYSIFMECDVDDVAEPISRMLNAVPILAAELLRRMREDEQ